MRPLQGRRIVVTRPPQSAQRLIEILAAAGAQPIVFPTIAIAPAEDTEDLKECLANLGRYQWIAFTSTNGVDLFCDRLSRHGAKLPESVRIAAVGPVTAAAIADYGMVPAFVAPEHRGEVLARTLPITAGERVLCPRSGAASSAMPTLLERRGAIVDDVRLYLPVLPPADPEGLRELERGVDAITFTSGSAVQNFLVILGGRSAALAGNAAIACLGPVTAAEARQLGLTVAVEPPSSTVEALVAALEDHFAMSLERKSP